MLGRNHTRSTPTSTICVRLSTPVNVHLDSDDDDGDDDDDDDDDDNNPWSRSVVPSFVPFIHAPCARAWRATLTDNQPGRSRAWLLSGYVVGG